MELKAGSRLRSGVCDTEVIVVRAPTTPVELQCGGAAMIAPTEPSTGDAVDPAHAEGTLIGKRYTSPELGLEVLCTKPGEGSLSVGGVPLERKDAKPLPSSD